MARPRSDDKRRRILEAAVRVFAKKGYFASRVSDVARRAGIADGTIYLYFRNKEDILVSLFDDVMKEHIARGREELRRTPGASAKLHAIAARHLRLLGENPDLAVVFQVELRQSTRFMERFTASWFKDYLELLTTAIAEGQKDGSLRAELPKKVLAKALFGALDEMVTSWMLGRRNYDLAELAPPVVELFLRGAQASQKASATRPTLRAVAGRGGR
jgi:TetR/AcrR family fatty acid metabolism transcriptional regulator